MENYKIEVREEFVKTIEIEATSKEEAYAKAREAYFSGRVFDNDDTSEVSYKIFEA